MIVTSSFRFAVAALLGIALLASNGNAARAVMYEGKPDLALTVSLVVAGGGPTNFDAAKAVQALAGTHFTAEYAKLKAQFGATEVNDSLKVFTFAVNDTLKAVTAAQIALPQPAPPPSDVPALRSALYSAGVTPSGKWDVGYFLEHLITHPIHHQIMDDMDKHFGHVTNENFHIVLTQLMHDLSRIQ